MSGHNEDENPALRWQQAQRGRPRPAPLPTDASFGLGKTHYTISQDTNQTKPRLNLLEDSAVHGVATVERRHWDPYQSEVLERHQRPQFRYHALQSPQVQARATYAETQTQPIRDRQRQRQPQHLDPALGEVAQGVEAPTRIEAEARQSNAPHQGDMVHDLDFNSILRDEAGPPEPTSEPGLSHNVMRKADPEAVSDQNQIGDERTTASPFGTLKTSTVPTTQHSIGLTPSFSTGHGIETVAENDLFCDTTALKRIVQENRQLREENDRLQAELNQSDWYRGQHDAAETTERNIQFIYCLYDNESDAQPDYLSDDHSDDHSDDSSDDDRSDSSTINNRGHRNRPKIRTYLAEPDWEENTGVLSLKGRSFVANADAHMMEKDEIDFAVYKFYSMNSHHDLHLKAHKANQPLPRPTPCRQQIRLVSSAMREAMWALGSQHPELQAHFPELTSTRLSPPFVWWYHYRKSDTSMGLPSDQAQLLGDLTNWIEENYSAFYNRIDDEFMRNRVSHSSFPFLIRPGEVLVDRTEQALRGYLVTKRPTRKVKYKAKGPLTISRSKGNSWTVPVKSIEYDGGFFYRPGSLEISLKTDKEDGEVSIEDLRAVPLCYSPDQVKEQLRFRGERLAKYHEKTLISYEGHFSNRRHAGQRFMLDYSMKDEFDEFNDSSVVDVETSAKPRLEPDFHTDGSAPQVPDVYLMPPEITGFDLRRKKWTDLEVDQIREVTWNADAFKHLVADEDTKEFIFALVTNQLASEKGTDLIENKGNGLIILLHGSPGTGKTYTAESVAEIARKPLYPVTCGDIGTEPEEVEKYLEQVFHLGKHWDCVVLLDEAEVFLEQRTLEDLKRNALVSVFLRALEYYDGILILTTNRVGTFDEAFKSRIQLAIRYEKLKEHQRKEVWQNFFKRLEGLGEEDAIDFDDVQVHYDDLARYEMNGRQIRNSVTTARQLAKYKGRKMTFAHLERAIQMMRKFDEYVSRVREGDIGDYENRDGNGRYSDEMLARADMIR